MESYFLKIFFISIFSLFLVFKNNFIRCIDFTRIATLNTESDDIINCTDLLYSCARFVVEIDEKSSHNGGF